MLVMRTPEDPAYPVGKLVRPQQTVGFHDLALGVHPLRLDGVEPRTLLGQQATHDPHPAPALLDSAVVPSEPSPDLPGNVPGSVVPNEDHDLLADLFELLQAPLKKPGGYGAHGSAVHESQPSIADLGQVESVAGEGLRLGVVFGDRPLDEAKGLAPLAPSVQGGQSHSTPPAFVLETHRPGLGIGFGYCHQSVAAPFFLSYRGSGEVIHLFALSHPTPSRRAKVARTVSPETRLSVRPSSKATSAAIC